jgi:hypothetical protein
MADTDADLFELMIYGFYFRLRFGNEDSLYYCGCGCFFCTLATENYEYHFNCFHSFI